MSLKRKRPDDLSEIRFYDQTKTYGELSNYWVPSRPLVHNGKTYPTSEHLYQALKYDYPGAPAANARHAEAIRRAKTPGIAKALANPDAKPRWRWEQVRVSQAKGYRDCGSVLNPDWDLKKAEAMLVALRAKFSQCAHCNSFLKSTGERRLVEAATSDSYWGIGRDGKGLNMLGILLESVRMQLFGAADAPPAPADLLSVHVDDKDSFSTSQ